MKIKQNNTSILMSILFLSIFSFASAQWNKALHFNYLEHDFIIADTGGLMWPATLNEGTVEMWFRPDSILKYDTHDPDYTWLFSKNISGNNAGDMGLCWKRDQGAIQGFIQDGTNTTAIYTDQEIWQPRWTHVAYCWNTQDSMRIFVNGVLQSDIQPDGVPTGETSPAVEGGPQAIVIGSGSQNLLYSRYETFRGQIDEVRISAVARYTTDFTPHTSPHETDAYTLALYHFDEGSGDVTADATGNGFDCVLGDPDTLGLADPAWVDVVYDRKLMVNEVLVDPATDNEATTTVVEGDANGDGVRQAQHDEFVEILNISDGPIDMTGWKVGDDERIDWQFPDGYTLNPYEFVTIFGGGGDSLVNVPGWTSDSLTTRVFATGDSIGNGLANGGDYMIIQSAAGNHDMYFAYGSKYGAGPPTSDAVSGIDFEFKDSTNAPANRNNSITREYDADPESMFKEHILVSGDSTDVAFSPNATNIGNPTLAFPVSVSVEAGSGTFSISPDSTTLFSIGSTVSVTAVADPMYVFDHWELNGVETFVNPSTLLISGTVSLKVYFVPAFQKPHSIIFNEINADPDSDPIIGDANADGIRNAVHDEFVELVNMSSDTVDMTGWMLGDDERVNYTFPEGYKIAPGQLVVIFGAVNHGDNENVAGYNSDIYQSSVLAADTIGNGIANGGEYVVLQAPGGMYDTYVAYGSKYLRGPPKTDATMNINFEMRVEIGDTVNNNNSVTRNPDGDTTSVDPFRQHLRVNNVQFSPGTTIDGSFNLLGLNNDFASLPKVFNLKQNYPNPFNPHTSIEFTVPVTSDIRLEIYNVMGQKINTLVNKETTAGLYRVQWNGTDINGVSVSTGMYFYRLEADGFSSTKKMLLIK
ncbi:MAG: hypothetical protein CMG74_11385 [Candidatus Marinimicrobia bacterium]|nr:hypothetical protein [Candidatus Neomarinimicrobiota bacterium]